MASTSGDWENPANSFRYSALGIVVGQFAEYGIAKYASLFFNRAIAYDMVNNEPVFLCSSISNQFFELIAEMIPKFTDPDDRDSRGRCEDAVNKMKAEIERIVNWVATGKRRITAELKADELYQREKRIAERESYCKPHSSQSLPTTPPRHHEGNRIQDARRFEVMIFWSFLDDLRAYGETDAPREAQRPSTGRYRGNSLTRQLESMSQ
ncbi:hypothetical protein B0A49_08602 [Cryomyces minteri]|uniref:Uncharacterized protein n=1 Tax=Cryomyces minteri TaxID=331657 RepID=A0A4U0WR29_9PEZI|nr:hypothetical protein B0A49_08602 [Cryomyces minteri]